jgi:hypothetical protein
VEVGMSAGGHASAPPSGAAAAAPPAGAEMVYLVCRYGVYSYICRMKSLAMVVWGEVMWALVMACSMTRHMHSWSYSGLAMLVPCLVCMALLPLEEKIISPGYSEW